MSSEFAKVDKVIGTSPDEARELNKLHDTPGKNRLSKLQKGILAGTGVGTAVGGTAVAVEQGWIKPPAIIEQGQKTAQKIDEKLKELGLQIGPKTAEASGDSRTIFQQVWDMADADVEAHIANRSWYWGPSPISGIIKEPYQEAPGGVREVQYWDKARMENNPNEVSFPWAVTNGLLVSEMMNGKLQLGDNKFENRAQANINVAGDPGSDGVTYAKLKDYAQLNAPVYPAFAKFNADTSGKWYGNDVYGPGLPVTRAFETIVYVGGVEKKVTVQAFERRVLTETKDNPDPFKVEMGNAGQHYVKYRYPNGLPNTGGELPAGTEIYQGNGWKFTSNPGALLSLVPTNPAGLDQIPGILGPGSPSIDFHVLSRLEEARDLGLDPNKFSSWDIRPSGGSVIHLGRAMIEKDQNGNVTGLSAIYPFPDAVKNNDENTIRGPITTIIRASVIQDLLSDINKTNALGAILAYNTNLKKR